MFKILILLLFLVISCSYPDIDSVPKFYSLNITMEEKLDKCKIYNNINKTEIDCFGELIKIFKRL